MSEDEGLMSNHGELGRVHGLSDMLVKRPEGVLFAEWNRIELLQIRRLLLRRCSFCLPGPVSVFNLGPWSRGSSIIQRIITDLSMMELLQGMLGQGEKVNPSHGEDEAMSDQPTN
jgi:hypothetical protein